MADGEKLRVVATTSIVGDVVAQVGGDATSLTVLIEPGQDPHAYQPSARDFATAAQAHVIFVNGFDLEENLLQDLESAAEGVPIVPVSAGIEPLEPKPDNYDGEGHSDEDEGEELDGEVEGEEQKDEQEDEEPSDEHEGEGDTHNHAQNPHVWLNVSHVERWTDNIEQVLSDLDPANAETYTSNAEAYEGELTTLDEFVRETVNGIPEENRKLVTNHDAFVYLAEAYGFEVIGTVIPNFSTNAEPSASDLSELIKTIKKEQVPAIFIDSSASDKLAQVVADETGAAVFELYTETLGSSEEGADSYIGMMRANVETIQEALGDTQ